MKVLCFQPHNDDCAIAVGGALQKMAGLGWELVYAYMTDGRHGSDAVPPEKLVEVRRREAEGERRLLGVERFFELGVEDGTVEKLSSVQRKWVTEQLESVLADIRPDLILLPSRADMHPDHRATHDLVLAAAEKVQPHPLMAKYFVWLFPDFYRRLSDPADQVLMVSVDREMPGKMAAIRGAPVTGIAGLFRLHGPDAQRIPGLCFQGAGRDRLTVRGGIGPLPAAPSPPRRRRASEGPGALR